jgi:hypothetical protein
MATRTREAITGLVARDVLGQLRAGFAYEANY